MSQQRCGELPLPRLVAIHMRHLLTNGSVPEGCDVDVLFLQINWKIATMIKIRGVASLSELDHIDGPNLHHECVVVASRSSQGDAVAPHGLAQLDVVFAASVHRSGAQ